MRFWILLSALALVAGCQDHGGTIAADSGQPPLRNPVGPVPGPDVALPLPRNPYANNAVAINNGRQWFKRYNCAGCHGGHGGGGMGPSLRDPDWIYGSSEPDIFADIAEGRAHGMPAWGTKLPADQVWELVAYIKSMGTPNEPEPPTP
ncbi:MAG TPA: c-type cytochrome [Thermoanaerobaculia bacterium]|nr:c-type cytochrome [Thermoanaerobaculia bacterium]